MGIPGNRTEAAKNLKALRESGYDGWVDENGKPVKSIKHPVTGKEVKLPPHGFDCKCSECR